MSDKDINFRDRDLLFVDLETTGLDLDKHEIIEIGCLVVGGQNLKIKKKYHVRVKPKHLETASKEGLEVSGYNKKDWVNAKTLVSSLKEVADLSPGAMPAGWKIDFDWTFLEKAFKEEKIKHSFDYHLIDVLSLAYRYFRKKKEPEGLGLRKVAAVMKIDIPEKHGAMVDIQATYKVFKILMRGK